MVDEISEEMEKELDDVLLTNLAEYEQYRNKHIGTKLIEAVENYHKNKGFQNINLTTYSF